MKVSIEYIGIALLVVMGLLCGAKGVLAEEVKSTTFLEEINKRYDIEISLDNVSFCKLYMVKAKKWEDGIMITPIRKKEVNLTCGLIGEPENLNPFAGVSLDIEKVNDGVKKIIEVGCKLLVRKELDLDETPVTTTFGTFVSREKDKDFDYGLVLGLKVEVDF